MATENAIRILLEFETPDSLQTWMKSTGYSSEEITFVLDELKDWNARPAPTELGVKLLAKSYKDPRELVKACQDFTHRKIGFSDLKRTLDKYK